jgi:hypothetical protein
MIVGDAIESVHHDRAGVGDALERRAISMRMEPCS